MQSVSIVFYDGVLSKPHPATLYPSGSDGIRVQYDDNGVKEHLFSRDQMTLIGAIGQRNPAIELNNDARIEFQSLDIPDWLPVENKSFNKRIWTLERSPSLILFSVVFVLALAFAVVKWGIPMTANVVAFKLPENTLNRLGNQAETYVNDYTKPSKLPKAVQEKIQAEYLSKVAKDKPAKLKFREGDRIGANALALPNNTIIVTDELINLAHSDQEIIGVLAHEQGHLLHRHSLQQALSSLGFSVLYVAITGDSSDLLTTLPLAIVGANYSRKFEKESDLYALNLMHEQKIETSHFANLLQRMSEEVGEEDQKGMKIFDVFSSHPATKERIEMVRKFEEQHQKNNLENKH